MCRSQSAVLFLFFCPSSYWSYALSRIQERCNGRSNVVTIAVSYVVTSFFYWIATRLCYTMRRWPLIQILSFISISPSPLTFGMYVCSELVLVRTTVFQRAENWSMNHGQPACVYAWSCIRHLDWLMSKNTIWRLTLCNWTRSDRNEILDTARMPMRTVAASKRRLDKTEDATSELRFCET